MISYMIEAENDMDYHHDHEVVLKFHTIEPTKQSEIIQLLIDSIPAVLEEVYFKTKPAKAVSNKKSTRRSLK